MNDYSQSAPTRDEVDSLEGVTLLEFGTDWCGHCRAAQPMVSTVLVDYPHVRLFKIEDGPGKPLGRSYHVKLWPTLVFLRNGQEVARLVRPTNPSLIEEAFEQAVGQG